MAGASVPRLYRSVVDDVIKNVRDAFLNDGVDEQVLQELKQLWENKLLQSRAIDCMPADLSSRVTLTYPHKAPQQQTSHEPTQANIQEPRAVMQPPPSTMIDPRSGLTVYHPTLGDIGQMSAPAAQAAMALQGNQVGNQSGSQSAQHHPNQTIQGEPSSSSISQTQQHPGIAYPNSQQNPQQTSQRGPRMIYTDPNRQLPMRGGKMQSSHVIQVDGPNDSSDSDDEDYDSIDHYSLHNQNKDDEEKEEEIEEEDPLNSEDDVSEEDPSDLFETDNVVVCQYDKIARSKNRWKFHLKDGIMNLNSKDYVFHKAVGDSEW